VATSCKGSGCETAKEGEEHEGGTSRDAGRRLRLGFLCCRWSRGVEFGLEVEDGVPACAGFEPDVEESVSFRKSFVAEGTESGFLWSRAEASCLYQASGAFVLSEKVPMHLVFFCR